jgi:hypothetical protein
MPFRFILAPFNFVQGWSGTPVKIKLRVIHIEPGGFLSRAACQVFAEGMGQEAEGKKVTEREAVFWSGKL